MAKQSKDEIFNAFLADLKAINPQFEELAKDEKVSSKLREGVLARADYSASMDALQKERQDMQDFLTKERQKIDGWQQWYGTATTEFAQMQEQLQAYRDEYGDLTAQGKRAARHAGLTPEEFDKRLNEELQKREVAYMKFSDDLTTLKIEHKERFKENLDTAELFKVAGERNLPLDVAYSILTVEKVEAERKERYADELKRAREEGAKEALAKHNLPIVPSTSDIRVHTLDAKDVPTTSRDRVAAAVSAFIGGNKS